MSGHPAIEVRDLVVRFGERQAVSKVSLEVHEGEVFGFLGRNGAGKTTTIRCLLDLLRPDGGEARLFGREVRGAGAKLRREVGFLPGDLAFLPHLSGQETLTLFAGLQGGRAPRQGELLERLGFPREALARPVGGYSTGMRQALGIAMAFQHDPKLAILDEPSTGLDPIVRERFLELVRDQRAAGRTVFLSSHLLDEIERTADRLALLEGGQVVLVDAVARLRTMLPRTVRLRYADGREERSIHRGPATDLVRGLDLAQLADFDLAPGSLEELFRDPTLIRSLREDGDAAPRPARGLSVVRPAGVLHGEAAQPEPAREQFPPLWSAPLGRVLLKRHLPVQLLCGLAPVVIGAVLGQIQPIVSAERAALLPIAKAFQKFLPADAAMFLDPAGPMAFGVPLFHPLTLMAFVVAGAVVPLALPAGARTTGALNLLLAAPLDRRTLISTAFLATLPGIAVVAAAPVLGIFFAMLIAQPPGALPWPTYALIAVFAFVLSAGFAALALAVSSWADHRGKAMTTFGVGIAVCFLFELGGRMAEKVEWLTKLSPIGWYPATELLAQKNELVILGSFVLLAVIAIGLGFAWWRAHTRRFA